MDKDFVVKNGLIVNTSLIVANGTNDRVGINNSTPDSTLTVTGTANVSGNVYIGSDFAVVGNTTLGSNVQVDEILSITGNLSLSATSTILIGTATINATNFNRTSNNTLFVGAVTAANVVSNAQLSSNLSNYQTTAGLSANVATLTANNTSFVGTVTAANVVSNAQLSSNLSNYQTTAGLSANVATLTANNTSFVGLVTAANVVSNAQLSSNLSNYQTTAGLSANVAKLTANNTTNFGGNPVAYYTNADNISTGTVPSARVSGSYSGITVVGTLVGVAVTGNSNFDSGVLFVDGTNNRVGVNNTTPDAALTVTGSANVSGNLTVTGDFIISGNVTSTGNTVSTGDFLPIANGYNLGNTISRWDLFGVDIALSNTISISTINTTANGIFANNTTLVIGNSSVNALINSTAFTGAANNSTNFNGQPASFYANGDNITTGTVAAARLPAATDTTRGAVILVNSISNTSITVTATANNVKTAYDAAIAANTRAASAQTAAIAAYSNAVTFASNGDNISSGTVAAARLPAANDIAQGAVIIVNSISNTSITATASANNVKTAYDVGIAANTRATSAQTAAVAAYSNAVTFASDATNISLGTVAAARLPAATDTTRGAVILVNSISNTSITATASANNVKTAYDAAIAAYSNAVTFASSGSNITTGTVAAARLPAATDTTQGAVILVNSISNTSITATASANNVKTAYDAAIAANTRAASAQTAATDANTRAASAQTAATDAYSNAVTFASNATNISLGTLAAARLPAANDIAQGAVIIVNSVTNASITATATANNVKTAYDAAIAANTRASSAQTAAVAAYSNAVTFASNATNISLGTLNTSRLTGSYTGITGVGTLAGVAVTGNSNFDSGVLFVDGTNNRVGVNTISPSVTLQISSNDAIFIPVGNTNQRPSGANGMLRYNGELNTFEGYANSAWGEVGGSGGGYYKGNLGAVGKPTNKDNIYRINSNTQSTNITIAAGENALAVGPIVVTEGFNLVVEEGGRAVII